MAVVVATRMTVARQRWVLRFMAGSLAAARQAQRSPGFLAGRLRAELPGTFWTLTMWESGRDMLAFRDTGAHARVLPRLAGWASEAVFGVWNTDAAKLPGWAETARLIAERPNFAPLDNPGPAQLERRPVAPRAPGFILPLRRRARARQAQ